MNCAAIHQLDCAVEHRGGDGESELATRARNERTTSGIEAAELLQKLMQDAHGAAFVSRGRCRLHELNRDSPYWSNLEASTLVVTRRSRGSGLVPHGRSTQWVAVTVACSGWHDEVLAAAQRLMLSDLSLAACSSVCMCLLAMPCPPRWRVRWTCAVVR